MTKTIAVAGATGNLGGRIIAALSKQGADVRAIVRPGTAQDKLDKLRQQGVAIVEVDMASVPDLSHALEGTDCVVSALQGLHDVIVDTQSALLAAAVAAQVARFIPSDFCSDFTKIPVGENRNFDLRHEFRERLDAAPIAATSILNGAFGEILTYGPPILDLKNKTVGYWGSDDFRVDFTTMDDTAAFTAAAAMDSSTPRILRIAGIQISASELAAVAEVTMQTPFKLVDMGSLEELSAHNKRERAAHPEGENEVFASWQMTQYNHSMFSTQLEPLDNQRYPQLHWTTASEVLATLAQ